MQSSRFPKAKLSAAGINGLFIQMDMFCRPSPLSELMEMESNENMKLLFLVITTTTTILALECITFALLLGQHTCLNGLSTS